MSDVSGSGPLKGHNIDLTGEDLPTDAAGQPPPSLPDGGANLPEGGQKIESAWGDHKAKNLVEMSMAKIGSSMLSQELKSFKEQSQQDWGTVSSD